VKTVAFLQNSWFQNPRKARKLFELFCGDDMDKQAQWHARYLFFRCLTGKLIKKAFGEELCRDIIWENANPGFVGESSGRLPADNDHIRRVLDHFKPATVLLFGQIAMMGAGPTIGEDYPRIEVICGPHPAARQADVPARLSAMAAKLRERNKACLIAKH